MKIAELARRAGVAPSAVRWYEQAGVLPAPTRRSNGYREYDDKDLARVRLVISLRRLGLGPEDAGRLARLCLERGVVEYQPRAGETEEIPLAEAVAVLSQRIVA